MQDNAPPHAPWLRRYPVEVARDIDPDQYRCLPELFSEACKTFASRPAFTNMGQTLSFAEVEQRSNEFACFLQRELKLAKGDRVAVMMPNLLQYPLSMIAVLKIGCVLVNVNPLYTAGELAHQLKDSGAKVLIAVENFAHTVEEALKQSPVEHVVLTSLGDMLPTFKRLLVNFVVKRVKKMVPAYHLPGAHRFLDALAAYTGQTPQAVEIEGSDLCCLQYTGGTTGVAKGAMLTHRNLVANLQQVSSYLGYRFRDGQEIVITALPLYHIFCFTSNCLTFMKHGGLNVLITNPRDLPSFIKELKNWKFTVITGVSTLFNALLNHPEFATVDFSAMQLSVGGGMAVQPAVASKWKQLTGQHLLEGYGLTEASPVVCVNPTDLSEYNGTIGLPLPSTELRLVDESGVDVATGDRGEIWVRGPQVMRGYWNRPEETKKVLTTDGWLRTGDIATMDGEGFVKIVDRLKDMIVVSGFNVFPNEVEAVVGHHPAVDECACIGVPDEKSGEAVKVFVKLKQGATLELSELREHCKQQLTGYKLPKHLGIREELPKTNVGKILRRALKE